MKKIKAIVFDLDDTLFLENLFRRSGFNFIAKKLNRAGISVTSKKIFQMSKQYPKTLFNEIVFRYHLSYSPEDLLGWYRNHPPKIRAYPGVKLLLKRLKREYKIKRIVSVSIDGIILSPCGSCRELMYQIDDKNYNTKIILEKNRLVKLSDLLPEIWQKKFY